MASCRICGIHFNNAQQLGAHVRRCKRAEAANAAAAAAAGATAAAHTTTTEPVIITEPVVAPAQTANTDLLVLARRERWGGKKWRTISGPLPPNLPSKPSMPCLSMAKDYKEVSILAMLARICVFTVLTCCRDYHHMHAHISRSYRDYGKLT